MNKDVYSTVILVWQEDEYTIASLCDMHSWVKSDEAWLKLNLSSLHLQQSLRIKIIHTNNLSKVKYTV